MKLRIRGNSIRLRLGESEVARLAQEGRVSESAQFSAQPENQLTFTVETSRASNQIFAHLAGSVITIQVPEAVARQWANSAQVGLSHQQPLGNDATLSILIEKDFRCLDPRPEEDPSDAYPHPDRHEGCDPR